MPDLIPNSWPVLLIGLVMLVYWLRVMQMVRNTPKQAGHHANLIPEEKLGKYLRLVWTPVIVLWIALPIAGGFGLGSSFTPLRPVIYAPWVQWLALAVVLIAFAITWVCWIRMGKSWRMGIDPNEKTQLVLTGPYSYVRHPIYGLSSLMMIMTALALPSPAMIVVALLHVVLMVWEVGREDAYLSAVHGEPYVEYRRHVGRFVPRSLKPYQSGRA